MTGPEVNDNFFSNGKVLRGRIGGTFYFLFESRENKVKGSWPLHLHQLFELSALCDGDCETVFHVFEGLVYRLFFLEFILHSVEKLEIVEHS